MMSKDVGQVLVRFYGSPETSQRRILQKRYKIGGSGLEQLVEKLTPRDIFCPINPFASRVNLRVCR